MFKVRIFVLVLLSLAVVGNVFAQGETPKVTFEEALECVTQALPAESYMTNDFLPAENAEPPAYTEELSIRVGLGWIQNDEFTPIYVAQAQGYFDQVGLDVEIVPGGPGIDPLLSLGGGSLDIAIAAGGSTVPAAVVSATPIDLVAVGTMLKGMPYTYLTIDEELQGRDLTPEDLVGRVVAVQPGAELYLYMLLDKHGIDREAVELAEAGYSPEILMVGQADYFSGWIMNQPRALEESGYEWNQLRYSDWVYNEYSDVVAVRRETAESPEGQDMLRRFMWALTMGTQFMLDQPEDAAEIAVEYSGDVELTAEQALWRFNAQAELVTGESGRLMEMNPDAWNEVVATLYQYDQIALACD